MARHETLAAVDLGSNSFHLLVGRIVDGQIYPLDTLREQTQLAAGLTADKRLDRASQARALEVLAQFRERLRGLPRDAVRAVGTNALRIAKNSSAFLREARETLGFPIEVIAGREEARLIYLGVAHALPPAENKRLVVDIGGGSTELIVGQGLKPKLLESLYVGCVSSSLRHFPEGRIDKKSLKAAVLEARQELAVVSRRYRRSGWQEAVGSSGTAQKHRGDPRREQIHGEWHHARGTRQHVGPARGRRPRRPGPHLPASSRRARPCCPAASRSCTRSSTSSTSRR